MEPGAYFGEQVALADVSGDGLDDVIVGQWQEEGAAFVFFAPLHGTVSARDADIVVRGSSIGEYFGRGIAAADFTGDGGVDLAVGACGIRKIWRDLIRKLWRVATPGAA